MLKKIVQHSLIGGDWKWYDCEDDKCTRHPDSRYTTRTVFLEVPDPEPPIAERLRQAKIDMGNKWCASDSSAAEILAYARAVAAFHALLTPENLK